MARLDKIATHDGVVTSAADGVVNVVIAATSACAACEAHSKCGFAESKDKTMAVPCATWEDYTEGEHVTVNIGESRGLAAVWLAYVLPAIVILAAVTGLSACGAAEWLVALVALAVACLYPALLYAMRRKIEKKFQITISKKIV